MLGGIAGKESRLAGLSLGLQAGRQAGRGTQGFSQRCMQGIKANGHTSLFAKHK